MWRFHTHRLQNCSNSYMRPGEVEVSNFVGGAGRPSHRSMFQVQDVAGDDRREMNERETLEDQKHNRKERAASKLANHLHQGKQPGCIKK